MAKSKALVEAEKTILNLNLEIEALRNQEETSINRDEEIARLLSRLEQRAKRYDDLRAHSAQVSKSFVETAIALAGFVVDLHKARGAGPFKCAGITDYDPQNIFEYFAKKIPGGDHWLPEKTDDSKNTETFAE